MLNFVLILATLAVLIGWVWLLITTFREGFLWGVGFFLFSPIVGLFFAIVHWPEAKRPFLTYVLGMLMLLGSALLAPYSAQGQEMRLAFSKAFNERLAAAQGVEKGGTTEDQRAAKEAAIHSTEAQLVTVSAKVTADYAALSAQRAKLGNDPAAIAAFNQQAAAYQAANGQLEALKASLVKLKAEEADLTQKVLAEAREAAKTAKKPGAAQPASGFSLKAPIDKARAVTKQVAQGDVVMYTTQRCPACVAAKNYMNKNGIPYQEIDVERDSAGMAEFRRRGGTGVPLIVVKGKQMTGFSPQALDALL
jgi:glutaredoxin